MFSAALASKDGNLLTSIAPLCLKRIEYDLKWITLWLHSRNECHDKCPICQTELNSINDSWVLSELPKTDEVSEEILTELNSLTKGPNAAELHSDDDDDDSDN